MKLFNVYGKLVNKYISQYCVQWDAPCRSIIQFKVKQFLKPYWGQMICYEEFPCFGSLLKVDLLNMTLKIAVETQGKQHNNFNKFFHNNSPSAYILGMRNDLKKAEWLKINNIKLIEIMENEIPYLTKDFFEKKFEVTL